MSTVEPHPHDTHGSRRSRTAAAPAAPNNIGLALLGLMALLLIAAVVLVGVPALDGVRTQASCVTLVDGTSSADESCGG